MSKLLTKEDKYEVLPSSAMAPPPKYKSELARKRVQLGSATSKSRPMRELLTHGGPWR
jgi:hypothetical protein